jgi:FkbM family methyltransferase
LDTGGNTSDHGSCGDRSDEFARRTKQTRFHLPLERLSSVIQEGGPDAEGSLSAEGTLDVDVVTLDGIAYATPGLAPPSVLKIDVEGAEQRVLIGADRILSEAKPDILLSTHGRENYVGCQVTLARYGYTVRQMSAEAKGTELLATMRG